MLTLTDVIRYGAFKPSSWRDEAQHSFDKLIDLIKKRVDRDGVEGAMHSLLDEVFELRMLVIPILLEQKTQEDLTDFVLDRQLALRDQPTDQYDQLFADVLKVLHQISYPHLQSLPPQLEKGNSAAAFDGKAGYVSPKLPTFRATLSYVGAPKEVYELLESSLKADFNGILYELLRSGRLPFLSKYKKEIVYGTFKHTEDFGFYSALLNLWKPDNNNEGELVRNVKVRLALYQLDHSSHHSTWELGQVRDLILQ